MSHEIIISEANVELEISEANVELDYSDIYENIADSVRDEAREAVCDYAWDEVCSNVEQMIDDNSSSCTDMDGRVEEMLNEYNGVKSNEGMPCSLGRAFERAVRYAVPASGVTEATLAVDDLKARITTQERLVSNLLGQIERLGEQAGTLGRGVSS